MFSEWLKNKDPELHTYLEMGKKSQLVHMPQEEKPMKISGLGPVSLGHGHGRISGGGTHKQIDRKGGATTKRGKSRQNIKQKLSRGDY
jgi:hypothetical protein